MADLPEIDEIEDNLQYGDDYEHPEPDTPEGGCSNLGEIPAEIAQMEDPEAGEDELGDAEEL